MQLRLRARFFMAMREFRKTLRYILAVIFPTRRKRRRHVLAEGPAFRDGGVDQGKEAHPGTKPLNRVSCVRPAFAYMGASQRGKLVSG